MPKVRLVANSSLMTATGLFELGDIGGEAEVVVVDRNGRPLLANVSIRSLGNIGQTAYIGCTRSFGPFHPETLIMDSDGVSLSAHELINSSTISDHRFEIEIEPILKSFSNKTIMMLRQKIRRHSLVESENYAVLFARTGSTNCANVDFISIETSDLFVSGRCYLVVDLGAFALALDKNWKKAIRDLVSCWLNIGGDENLVEFEVDKNFWLHWYLMATSAEDYYYRLHYDSLQHSTIIGVDEDHETLLQELSKGGVGFLQHSKVEAYEVHWADSQWNLLSSGFILSSS